MSIDIKSGHRVLVKCINSAANDEYGFLNIRRIKKSDILDPEVVVVGYHHTLHFSSCTKRFFEIKYLMNCYHSPELFSHDARKERRWLNKACKLPI